MLTLTRKLHFILLGNKETGKTTLAKLLTEDKPGSGITPTKEIQKYTGIKKLESSRNSSIFTLERWRKYKINIIDVPGSFNERRQWRDAYKKSKKPYAVCMVIDPYQSIPETQSVLEEVYNQYLESISTNIEKADQIASQAHFLLLFVFNHFQEKGEFQEHEYYNHVLRNTVSIIRKKMPLILVDYLTIDLNNWPENYYDLNSILERIKRFYYRNIKIEQIPQEL